LRIQRRLSRRSLCLAESTSDILSHAHLVAYLNTILRIKPNTRVRLRRKFEILSSSQSYGLVRRTNPPPGQAYRATRGRRFARGGGPAPNTAILLVREPTLFNVPEGSTGRRSSCPSLAVYPPSAVACPAQTKSQRAAPDSDILDVPSDRVGAPFVRLQCDH
jgi:hypothetical protein